MGFYVPQGREGVDEGNDRRMGNKSIDSIIKVTSVNQKVLQEKQDRRYYEPIDKDFFGLMVPFYGIYKAMRMIREQRITNFELYASAVYHGIITYGALALTHLI